MNPTIKKHTMHYGSLLLFVLLLTAPISVEAQRFGHGSSMSRPNVSRPSTGRQPINGGFQRETNRSFPSSHTEYRRPSTNNNIGNRNTNIGNDRNINSRSNNTNVRTNRNIDNSTVINNRGGHNNVNINVNNRNTIVRPAIRPYPRPPYFYGGFSYYSFHPYFYHPFTPFYWGPVWHPWGFFVASLATTAIIVSIENSNQQYYYDQGNYYMKEKDGYTVVQAPVGATIKVLPDGYQVVDAGGDTTVNNYYYGGTYYEKDSNGYTVVPPTAGTLVEHLPEGGEEVRIGDQTYVKYGETYYQPVQVNGKNQYEVVDVKEGQN
ncbi:DUF6515 family protein [Galbibacter sp. PAP.153]|uniref:DUF6515 family protein n=1 Tax=Galbibacter sp. PAP.153 TaxID=3104623 RepID=UPI0030086351